MANLLRALVVGSLGVFFLIPADADAQRRFYRWGNYQPAVAPAPAVPVYPAARESYYPPKTPITRAPEAPRPDSIRMIQLSVNDGFFEPSMLNVAPGTFVQWTNRGKNIHTVTSDGNFCSGDLAPGSSFGRTFDRGGTFSYHCRHHKDMKGSIVVDDRQPAGERRPGY